MTKDKKCRVCDKEYDQKEKNRVYGKDSIISLLDVCSAKCYTDRNGSIEKKITWNDDSLELLLKDFAKDIPVNINVKEWLKNYKIKNG